VAVTGGGNAAIDSARSALRLGAKEVTVFTAVLPEKCQPARGSTAGNRRRYQDRIPGQPYPHSPDRRCSGSRMYRMKLGDVDAAAADAPNPCRAANSRWSSIISSKPSASSRKSGSIRPSCRTRNIVTANLDTLATSKNGIFAGGRCHDRPGVCYRGYCLRPPSGYLYR